MWEAFGNGNSLGGDRTPLSKSKEREGFEFAKIEKMNFVLRHTKVVGDVSLSVCLFGCFKLSSRAQLGLKHIVGV